ncbi:hypothetical protein PPTG_16857, partial [Phytophthora nicotianae INRA-310]
SDTEGDGERGGPGAKEKKRLRCDYSHAILRDGKKRRVSTRTKTRHSALAKLVSPISNTVERLFLTCKLIMTPQRSCMLPANFEMIAFLRVNREMWNASTLIEKEE